MEWLIALADDDDDDKDFKRQLAVIEQELSTLSTEKVSKPSKNPNVHT